MFRMFNRESSRPQSITDGTMTPDMVLHQLYVKRDALSVKLSVREGLGEKDKQKFETELKLLKQQIHILENTPTRDSDSEYVPPTFEAVGLRTRF